VPACSPGADVNDVWLRLSQFEMLRHFSKATGARNPADHREATWVTYAGPPFDVEELIRLIKKVRS
jgi:hypothetical protein